jgi:hypothetical protein
MLADSATSFASAARLLKGFALVGPPQGQREFEIERIEGYRVMLMSTHVKARATLTFMKSGGHPATHV